MLYGTRRRPSRRRRVQDRDARLLGQRRDRDRLGRGRRARRVRSTRCTANGTCQTDINGISSCFSSSSGQLDGGSTSGQLGLPTEQFGNVDTREPRRASRSLRNPARASPVPRNHLDSRTRPRALLADGCYLVGGGALLASTFLHWVSRGSGERGARSQARRRDRRAGKASCRRCRRDDSRSCGTSFPRSARSAGSCSVCKARTVGPHGSSRSLRRGDGDARLHRVRAARRPRPPRLGTVGRAPRRRPHVRGVVAAALDAPE